MSWYLLRDVAPLSTITDMNLFRRQNNRKTEDILPAAYSAMFTHAIDCIFIVDQNNLLLSLNPAARRLLKSVENERSDLADEIGLPIRQVLAIWPSIGPFLNSTDKEHVTSVESESRCGLRSFEVRITPVLATDGRFTGRMLLVHETTELDSAARALHQRKQQLRMMVERLQKIDRLRTNYTDQLTHELRTSLTRIDLHINSLRREIDDGWVDSVDRIEQEIAYLYKRIESILESNDYPSATSRDAKPSAGHRQPIEGQNTTAPQAA